jgi:hypothetical protein
MARVGRGTAKELAIKDLQNKYKNYLEQAGFSNRLAASQDPQVLARMEGLKNLFTEHFIDIPQEKVDVLEALADKVEALELKLDEVIVENVELRGVLAEESAKNIFEELASDLALTQQDKFAALAEGIEFDGNLGTYEKKLRIVKENYFGVEKSSYSSNIEEETFEGEVSHNVNIDPQVNRYVQALARTVKK